jgi:hypothetical protein
MSGPIYSDDGFWMWNGTEWIPATQPQNVVPTQEINQATVANVATQVGVQPQQVAAVAPHFDLNQDGVIDSNEMMQAAQSVANPVNVAAPPQANVGAQIPGNMAVHNPSVFSTAKKRFDWKEKKMILIGGIVTITIAMGVLLFFLLSGNPLVGTWVGGTGDTTYNKNGTFQSTETTGAYTWETDGDKLIQTVKSTFDGNETTITQTAQYELTDDDNVLWLNIISIVDQDGNNMMVITNPFTDNETELEFPCIALLRDSASNAGDYYNTIPSYQSSKPSWCTD